MSTKDIVPMVDKEGNFGSGSRKWRSIYCNSIVFDDGTILSTEFTSSPVGNIFDTGWFSPASSTIYQGAHGLLSVPKTVNIWARLRSLESYNNYDDNDEWLLGELQISYIGIEAWHGFCIKYDDVGYYITTADEISGKGNILHINSNGDRGNYYFNDIDVKFIFMT